MRLAWSGRVISKETRVTRLLSANTALQGKRETLFELMSCCITEWTFIRDGPVSGDQRTGYIADLYAVPHAAREIQDRIDESNKHLFAFHHAQQFTRKTRCKDNNARQTSVLHVEIHNPHASPLGARSGCLHRPLHLPTRREPHSLCM